MKIELLQYRLWPNVVWKPAQALIEGDRVVVMVDDNELINCSRSFFDTEVAKGHIRVEKK